MESIINPESGTTEINQSRPFQMGFLFFAGVLLPFASLGVELVTQMSAENFFDPMPTWWHTFFVFFVAATNLQTWWALRHNRFERLGWLGFANALAIFLALFYTILYAPILPLAVIGLIFLIGILPMAPLFSLIAACLMRRRLRREAPGKIPFVLRWQGLLIGFFAAFLTIGLAELPLTLTKIGILKANADSIEKQNEGLEFLRKYADRDYLLRLCYSSSGVVTTDFLLNALNGTDSLINLNSNRVQTDEARKVYYRLTGKDFRTVPAPRGVKEWQRFDLNATIGDDSSQINKGLSLAGSQMDGSVDGDASVSYIEWTLTLKNENGWQQEAVSQIQLPPGAVVSRLTLWVNGEEREAAFAKPGKVTEAYNAVVNTRKDPVLVTTSGRDRISMRAFPVPPNGEMKIRIGITAPLVLENESSGLMLLPYFEERNFSVATAHAVWIESKKPLEIANSRFMQEQKGGLYAVRGGVKNEELVTLGSPVRVAKSADVKSAWARDKNNPEIIVRQEIQRSNAAQPERIVFVVDASLAMKDFQEEIAEALKNLPSGAETALIFAGGNGYNLDAVSPNSFTGEPSEIAAKVENATFEGGTDSVSAIERAWNVAQEKPHSAIVWLHAPQPVELTAPSNLTQFWTRRPNSTPVYSLAVRQGKNATATALNQQNILQTVPRFGKFGDDLSRFLNEFNREKSSFVALRTIENAKDFKTSSTAKETSSHLVRLWANEEVGRLIAQNKKDEASDLAVKNQLVTPVSGAVVLETQAQYDQFGLRPVDANSVPTIPEPEEYLLFGVVLAFLIWMFRRFRRQNLRPAI